jgi:8-oxo-dGTP pyrophosphatase MutT (NUDIX family)
MENGVKKLFRQSGVIPLFEDRVVLITARKSGRWIIPKGFVEKGMSPAESAAKEAYEEAGVIGRVVDRAVGTFRFTKWDCLYIVQVFPLYIETLLDEWEEMELRQRKVVSVAEAVGMLHHEELKSMVAGFCGTPSSGRHPVH